MNFSSDFNDLFVWMLVVADLLCTEVTTYTSSANFTICMKYSLKYVEFVAEMIGADVQVLIGLFFYAPCFIRAGTCGLTLGVGVGDEGGVGKSEGMILRL